MSTSSTPKKDITPIPAPSVNKVEKEIRVIPENAQWFIVNCNSGHEDKVALDLNQRIEKLNLKDYIFEVKVIKESVPATKEKKAKEVNAFPGYIFIHMVMTEEAWYDVRNTPGVTGFIGSSGKGTKPFPLTEKEVKDMIFKNDKPVAPVAKVVKEFTREFEKGDYVNIISGGLEGKSGKVEKLDDLRGVTIIHVEIFGRLTEVTVEYNACKRVE